MKPSKLLADATLDLWLEEAKLSKRLPDLWGRRVVAALEDLKNARIAICALAEAQKIAAGHAAAGWGEAASRAREAREVGERQSVVAMEAAHALDLARAVIGGDVRCPKCGTTTETIPAKS
jgi:hypothetical protein